MGRNLIGRYYWPGRLRDVTRWCQSCSSCQLMGPLRSSTVPKSIMQLRPLDLMGMDFIGPFNPISVHSSRYVILAVDYFSRYCFAQAVQRNTGEVVVDFLYSNVTCHFGWPLAFYVDNGSHFVKGKLPDKLKQQGVKLFTAPITNPRSVGLSERYVKLILAGLRSMVQANVRPDAMTRWDEHLPAVVQAINTRVLKIQGYSPSQLLFGFNARLHSLDLEVIDDMLKDLISIRDGEEGVESSGREGSGSVNREYRLAQLEEIRELGKERVLRDLEDKDLRPKIARYQAPKKGDLVMRRRFLVDKSLGMKLSSKWDGPFKLSRISKSGVSGDLQDLKTNRIIGRYAFQALKVYLPREDVMSREVSWIGLDEGLREAQRDLKVVELASCDLSQGE